MISHNVIYDKKFIIDMKFILIQIKLKYIYNFYLLQKEKNFVKKKYFLK